MNDSNIKEFFQIKDESPLYIRSSDGTFTFTYISIKKNKREKLISSLFYHFNANEKEFCYSFPQEFETIEEVIDAVYEMSWEAKPCPECFELTRKETICKYCKPQRYFWEYGIQKKKVDSIPTCSICFEPVYLNRLECGHYFHVTCFSKYYKKKKVSCPNCRAILTDLDKSIFFLH